MAVSWVSGKKEGIWRGLNARDNAWIWTLSHLLSVQVQEIRKERAYSDYIVRAAVSDFREIAATVLAWHRRRFEE